jgi:octaheme c-type cytochrome (tetrathionate reductase family)
MKDFKFIWVIGLVVTAAIVIIPIILFITPAAAKTDDPWAHVPTPPPHTDHAALLQGPFTTGQEVTAACLKCHPDAAKEVGQTQHWTWLSQPVKVDGHDQPVAIGKKNLLNNFCIGIQSNWTGCTRCHAGYGWSDASFDFSKVENVDCLICHDQTGGYAKTKAGNPDPSVDLVASAQSVGRPTRVNCGYCHFNGGGGNGVKHGDLDESLYNPPENVDFHMGKLNFECVDCHKTTDHHIAGRSISVSVDNANQVYCTDCHAEKPHADERVNLHTASVACQTCHIPAGALRDPTKVSWDWSQAGQDIPEDEHSYLKIKGRFVFETNIIPDYGWFDGTSARYLLGDPIDPSTTTAINQPHGSFNDPNSKIWPFKIHNAKQPYDTVYNILLQPQTAGAGGYWTTFDWLSALTNGSKAAGTPFSGQYGFADTSMYWPLSHMVVPSQYALQCSDCHGDDSRFDWKALGYPGDPMIWGGRANQSDSK